MISGNKTDEISVEGGNNSRSRIAFISIVALITILVAGCVSPSSSEHQQMVHEMGPNVMPFDLTKTLHVFDMTDSGGVQQVIIRDQSYGDQLDAVREHLREEAMRFSMGDYSDPTTLHGTDMPGVKDLETGFSQINVSYIELSNGAQLVFETADLHLVTAIHRWFGAQLSDHGADATYR